MAIKYLTIVKWGRRQHQIKERSDPLYFQIICKIQDRSHLGDLLPRLHLKRLQPHLSLSRESRQNQISDNPFVCIEKYNICTFEIDIFAPKLDFSGNPDLGKTGFKAN